MITTADLTILEVQLKRPPRGEFDIIRRCRFNYPVILETEPVIQKTFDSKAYSYHPTRWWLSCPYLKKLVSMYESAGYIKQLEIYIRNNINNYKIFLDQQIRHSEEIAKCMKKFEPGISPSLWKKFSASSKYIAGVTDPARIKCLHAQLAVQLAPESSGSEAGRILQELFKLTGYDNWIQYLRLSGRKEESDDTRTILCDIRDAGISRPSGCNCQ